MVAAVVPAIVNASNIINLTVATCHFSFVRFLHFPCVLCAFTKRFFFCTRVTCIHIFQRSNVHDCSFHFISCCFLFSVLFCSVSSEQRCGGFQWLTNPLIVQFILFTSLKQTAFAEYATIKPSTIGRITLHLI